MKTLALFFASSLVAAYAGDITLSDGRILRDAALIEIDKEHAIVRHAEGIEGVDLKLLTPAMLKELRLAKAAAPKPAPDPAKDDRVQAGLLERVTDSVAALMLAGEFEILQVVDGGVLARGTARKGKPVTKYVERSAWRRGTGLDAHRNVLHRWTEPVDAREIVKLERIFIRCDTEDLVDGHRISRVVFPVGTFSYVNTQGARMTVSAYTIDIDEFLRYLERKAAARGN